MQTQKNKLAFLNSLNEERLNHYHIIQTDI